MLKKRSVLKVKYVIFSVTVPHQSTGKWTHAAHETRIKL